MLESLVFIRTVRRYLYLLGYECSGCFLMGVQGWSGLVQTVELYQRDLHSWLEARICSVIYSSFNMIQLIRLSGLKYSLSSGRRENVSYSPVPCTCLGAEKEVDSNGREGTVSLLKQAILWSAFPGSVRPLAWIWSSALTGQAEVGRVFPPLG